MACGRSTNTRYDETKRIFGPYTSTHTYLQGITHQKKATEPFFSRVILGSQTTSNLFLPCSKSVGFVFSSSLFSPRCNMSVHIFWVVRIRPSEWADNGTCSHIQGCGHRKKDGFISSMVEPPQPSILTPGDKTQLRVLSHFAPERERKKETLLFPCPETRAGCGHVETKKWASHGLYCIRCITWITTVLSVALPWYHCG